MEKYINRLNARGFYTIVLIIILVGFIAAGASGIILDFIVGIIKIYRFLTVFLGYCFICTIFRKKEEFYGYKNRIIQ